MVHQAYQAMLQNRYSTQFMLHVARCTVQCAAAYPGGRGGERNCVENEIASVRFLQSNKLIIKMVMGLHKLTHSIYHTN